MLPTPFARILSLSLNKWHQNKQIDGTKCHRWVVMANTVDRIQLKLWVNGNISNFWSVDVGKGTWVIYSKEEQTHHQPWS